MGIILLFYKYVVLSEPEAILEWQQTLCKSLDLRGRIILAKEGINGTVGGTKEATDAYIAAMEQHPLFDKIDFKTAPGGNDHFPRMRIVIKNEIVNLGLDTQKVSVKDTGTHLTPEQAHQLMNEAPENLVILDARNNYESRIGTFKGSLTPDIDTFREFPDYVDHNLEAFKDKKVLMHCTGGIRCERASAYLKQKGIAQEVYQIEGGIHRYIEKFPDGHFRGSNYVFDARIAQRVNEDVLGNCDLCNVACDYYVNCVNAQCNNQFLACKQCRKTYKECCSTLCCDLVESGQTTLRKKPLRPPLNV